MAMIAPSINTKMYSIGYCRETPSITIISIVTSRASLDDVNIVSSIATAGIGITYGEVFSGSIIAKVVITPVNKAISPV